MQAWELMNALAAYPCNTEVVIDATDVDVYLPIVSVIEDEDCTKLILVDREESNAQ